LSIDQADSRVSCARVRSAPTRRTGP